MKSIFSIVWLLVVSCSTVFAEDYWPQFRGPTGQGHSTAVNVPTSWSETENVQWKVEVPGLGWSSPVVKDGRIWLTTAAEEGKSLRLLSFDLKTGKSLKDIEIFQVAEPSKIHNKNSHASPTPLLEADCIYVHFGTHGTACVKEDGTVVWSIDLDYKHGHGSGGSPVLFEDLLIITCDGIDAQFMVALDKHTGKEKWRKKRDHLSEARRNGEKNAPQGYSTPLLIPYKNTTLLLSTGVDHVAAYDPRTGEEIWWSEYDGYSVIPRPVVAHDMVFVTSSYNKPVFYGVRLGGKGNVTESHIAWTLEKGAPHSPSPIVVGDEIYIVSDRGIGTCLDAKTGEQHWQERLGGNYSASPVYVGGLIYFQDEKGTTIIIEPGTELKEVARNTVEGRTLATFTPINNALLLRTDTHLYRIGE
ncbi:MAG: hypothetical protein COA78_23615 [Blastopirellula sp.]|nr:MAG: hypothetical protein COA78_23615 [Blastopirellula sp.]